MANPCNRGRKSSAAQYPGGALPTNPCELLALAKQQYLLLSMGQAVVAIETPELGRVEFSAAHIDTLQRLIDGLTSQCAAINGQTTAGQGRRKPISIEAWP